MENVMTNDEKRLQSGEIAAGQLCFLSIEGGKLVRLSGWLAPAMRALKESIHHQPAHPNMRAHPVLAWSRPKPSQYD
jgi:hypothetical protein